ncbi:MAG: nitrogen fixation NifU-like protein [Methylophilaceae bacterium]|jgi:nitrogen fixation NifU-like protein
MANPRALYQEVILDHNKKPRNFGALEQHSHHAAGHNPLCGDHIEVSLNLSGEDIESIAFQGAACAICKASASMMTVAVKGKTRSDTEQLMHEFIDMSTGKLNLSGDHHIGRLVVFAGIADLPVRVKCAILPWHTLQAALNAVESVSTEDENDPSQVTIGDA